MHGHRSQGRLRAIVGGSLFGLVALPLLAQAPPRHEELPPPTSPEVVLEPEQDAPTDFPPLDVAPSLEGASADPLPFEAVETADPAESVDPVEPEGMTALPDRVHLDKPRQPGVVEPDELGPLSIGTPDGGLLFNPVPMPEGPLWSVRNPHDSFATVETIAFITSAIEAVEARLPGSPPLVIGDISRADGGRLDRHKSHQAGRDADIGFYYRTGAASDLRPPRKGELDLARTWALLRAFVTETDVERVFVDRSVQRLLYDYALDQGEDREWLDNLFGRRGGEALVQHERRHLDHMHVRFFNREAQEHGRVAYPLLVRAGLLPGPTVKYRVRSGDTLSGLARRYGTSAAAIRTANGIHGSALRAGRTYVIPVRKVPTAGQPVAVPPRRLPPGPPEAEAAAAVTTAGSDFPDR